MDRFDVAVHNSALPTTVQLSPVISTGTAVAVPESVPLMLLKVFASAPAATITVSEITTAKAQTNRCLLISLPSLGLLRGDWQSEPMPPAPTLNPPSQSTFQSGSA